MASVALDIIITAYDKARGVLATVNDNLKEVSKNVDQANTRLEGTFKAAERLAPAFAVIGAALTGFAASSVKAASDAEEMASKSEVVFGEQIDQVREWAKAQGEAMGRSARSLEGYAVSLQDTFVPMGFARGEAAKMSEQVAKLGVDLASFNNMEDSEALDRLQSALIGNHEAVMAFGVVITEASLNEQLFQMGVKGGTQAATEQQKVMARLALILKGTGDAQNDAERTAGSLANQQKRLQEQVGNLQVAYGKALVPALQAVMPVITQLVERFTKWIESPIGQRVAQITASMGPLLLGLSGLLMVLPQLHSGWLTLIGILGKARVALVAAFTGGGPIVWIIGAVAALGLLIYGLVKRWDEVRAAVKSWWELCVAAIKAIAGGPAYIAAHWDELKQYFARWWQSVKEVFTGHKKAGEQAAEANQKAADATGKAADASADAAAAAGQQAQGTLAASKAAEALADAQEKLGDAERSAADASKDLEKARKDGAKAVQEAQAQVSEAEEGIREATEAGADAVQDAKDRTREAVEAAAEAQQNAAERVQEAEARLTEARESAAEAEQDALERLSDAREAAAEAATQAAEDQQEAVEALAEAEEDAAQRMMDAREAAADKVRKAQEKLAKAQEDAGAANRPKLTKAQQEQLKRQEAAQKVREAQAELARAKVDAQKDLQKAQKSTTKSVDKARERVGEAKESGQKRVDDAQKRVLDAEEAVTKAREDGQKRIAAATEAVSKAREAQVKATEDGQKRIAEAQKAEVKAVEDATKRIINSYKARQKAIDGVGEAQDRANESVANARDRVDKAGRAVEKARKGLEDVGGTGTAGGTAGGKGTATAGQRGQGAAVTTGAPVTAYGASPPTPLLQRPGEGRRATAAAASSGDMVEIVLRLDAGLLADRAGQVVGSIGGRDAVLRVMRDQKLRGIGATG